LKSGSLNLLQPSGPVQACIRIASFFPNDRGEGTGTNDEAIKWMEIKGLRKEGSE
jgi:hypothetical protein